MQKLPAQFLNFRVFLGSLILTTVALAAPPRVVKAVPDNGDREVDPELKEFRVEFDQPMSQGGMSIVGGGPNFPKLIGTPRWVDDHTLVMNWQLAPAHDYWLSINSGRFANFRGQNGESAVPHPIAFRTGGSAPAAPALNPEAHRQAFELLKRAINDQYSYRDLRRVDWEKRFAEYGPRMRLMTSPEQFAKEIVGLLSPAEDVHLWLEVGSKTVPTYIRRAAWNVQTSELPRAVPGWRERSPVVFSGQFPDGIRYLFIRSWPGDASDQLEPAFEVVAEAAEAGKPLIIDVRANGGGAEPLAGKLAGCFVDKPAVYAKHVVRYNGQFTPIMERTLEPNKARPHFKGRVAVLIGLGTVSSCESFAMMMKQAPGCTLIGGRTAGASGNPKPVDLGNGVTVYIPSWKDLRLDGTCLEGEGFAPDIEVKSGPGSGSEGDPVLAAALAHLRQGQ